MFLLLINIVILCNIDIPLHWNLRSEVYGPML